MENKSENTVLEMHNGYCFISKDNLKPIVIKLFGKSIEEFLTSYTSKDVIKVMNHQNEEDEKIKKKVTYVSDFKNRNEKKFIWDMSIKIMESNDRDETKSIVRMRNQKKFDFNPTRGLFVSFEDGQTFTIDVTAYEIKEESFLVIFKEEKIASNKFSMILNQMKRNGWTIISDVTN
jgi:hypothetical protein